MQVHSLPETEASLNHVSRVFGHIINKKHFVNITPGNQN